MRGLIESALQLGHQLGSGAVEVASEAANRTPVVRPLRLNPDGLKQRRGRDVVSVGDEWDRHPFLDGLIFHPHVPRPPACPEREDERERDRHYEGEPHGQYAPPRLSHNSIFAHPHLARHAIVDLKTRQVEDVPDSACLLSPRRSPDCRCILAMTADYHRLVPYNRATSKWEELAAARSAYPSWSKYVYFSDPFAKEAPFYRVRMSHRKIARLVNLADYGRLALGRFGWWTGLGPDDCLLATRDISIQEIYALDWQR